MVRRAQAVLAALAMCLPAARARAQAILQELSPGTSQSPNAQYVAIDSAGDDLTGYSLRVQNSSGQPLSDFYDFSAKPTAYNGYVLVATAEAAGVYLVAPAAVASSATLPVGSGRLCLYKGTTIYDCVAYGQFTGDNGLYGSPAVGVGLDQALTRVATTSQNFTDWQVAATPQPGTYAPAGDGGVPDAGVADAGTADGGTADGGDGGAVDGGNQGSKGPTGPGQQGGTVPTTPGVGCACTGGAMSPAIFLLGVTLVFTRRRRVDRGSGRR